MIEAFQRSRQVNRRRNPESPNDGDLKDASLGAGQHRGAYASAPKEDKQERADKLPRKPL